MEKKDYSKFSKVVIKENLPITFISDEYNKSIYDIFDKLNIRTLEDLFVAYDNGFFNDNRKRFYTEIKGQIELLMSYYMKTPLVADSVLETRVGVQSQDMINEMYENDELTKNLFRVGISKAEFRVLYQYCMNKCGKMSTYEDGTLSIIHIMQKFANDKEYQSGLTASATPYTQSNILAIQNLTFKSAFYEMYLEQEKYLRNGLSGFLNVSGVIDRNAVQTLEAQMKFLLNARNNLDAQIELLQNQLSNVKQAGGIRK